MGSLWTDRATRTRPAEIRRFERVQTLFKILGDLKDVVLPLCVSIRDLHEVPEARMCGEETFLTRGEVQHRQGDREQRDGVQGGEQEPELLQKRGGESGESPPVLLHAWRGCPQHLTTSLWWAQGQARGLGASSTQNRLAGLGLSLPLGGA